MKQKGQALAESIVLFPVLIGLLFMAHWLLYAQHEKSRLQLAAAHGAFLRTRLWAADFAASATIASVREAEAAEFRYAVAAHQWGDTLDAKAMPLADEVRLHEAGLHEASLAQHLTHAWFPTIKLRQQHVILVGSGEAVDAERARQRLETAPQWWQVAAQRSQTQLRRVAQVAVEVDEPWGRAKPDMDWLQRWEASVPPRYTK